MDEKTRMTNYSASDIVETIDEVRAARGEYGSLGEQTAQIKAAQTEISEIQKTQSEQETTITKAAEQAALNRSSLGLQRKNLFMNNCKERETNGITAKTNEDGSITLTGINASNSLLVIFANMCAGNYTGQYNNNKKFIPTGKYILSGGTSDVSLHIITSKVDNEQGQLFSCSGSEVEVNVTAEDKYSWGRLAVRAGASLNDVIIYPMLRPAEITDPTYEPYHPSLQEQIEALAERIAELKGKN